MRIRTTAVLLALVLAATAGYAQTPPPSTINISGVTYTKWLWGNQRYDGSLYNFTTVPGEGWGDNGQGTEIELLVGAKVNRYLEVSGRIHSRFSQNFWTNFGGFGGHRRKLQRLQRRRRLRRDRPALQPVHEAARHDRARHARLQVRGRGDVRLVRPGHVRRVHDGQDPLHRPRQPRRAAGQGSITENLRYDAIRISLPRLWAGPNFNTGEFTSDDSAYGVQLRWTGPVVDFTGIGEFVNDVEVDSGDIIDDDGRELSNRYRNNVGRREGRHPPGRPVRLPRRGLRLAVRPEPGSHPGRLRPERLLAGHRRRRSDTAWKINADITDPFDNGFSLNAEIFDIGADYTSILAARRESDVLLTEGHDGTFAFPGPSNGAFGVFGGNPTRIGYGGWQGNMQQVATINVDNEFTDFDEPMAETVIGWKGITIVPRWQKDTSEISGEYSHIAYNTNWQAWGDSSRGIDEHEVPGCRDRDAGVGNPYRSAYAPFQDKTTDIALIRAASYTAQRRQGRRPVRQDQAIQETDKRLNEARFLPYPPATARAAAWRA